MAVTEHERRFDRDRHLIAALAEVRGACVDGEEEAACVHNPIEYRFLFVARIAAHDEDISAASERRFERRSRAHPLRQKLFADLPTEYQHRRSSLNEIVRSHAKLCQQHGPSSPQHGPADSAEQQSDEDPFERAAAV